MKKHIFKTFLIGTLALFLASCEDWLLEPSPGVTKLEDFFTTGETAIQAVNGAYMPLMWEFNNTYYPEWFIGDVVSDDAIKGGQNIGDMDVVYDMENFKTASNNTYLLDFYRAQYQGIGRCNLILQQVPYMNVDTLFTQSLKDRVLGEAKFLRAMYYFRLVRIFGGVPKIDFVVETATQWKQPRASADAIYEFIIADLEDANQKLWKKSEYAAKDLGRATKGAAQAMLLKTNLYTKQYAAAKAWGDSIIESGEYGLLPEYADNFRLNGENGLESVFEIQYMNDEKSDYGEGNGFTRGTFTVILTRARGAEGWGFNKPTQNLYNEYESDDMRRDETILTFAEPHVDDNYLGNTYSSKKYALMDIDNSYISLAHFTRGPINNKVIRYADVLLMYAEACCELNLLTPAKWALEEVRARARNLAGDPLTALPEFPYGSYTDTQDDLRSAIRHERRVELAMEGHRWFDLVRWGIAKETMDAYALTETEEARAHMSTFVAGKHELFPIPIIEIDLNPMPQNPMY